LSRKGDPNANPPCQHSPGPSTEVAFDRSTIEGLYNFVQSYEGNHRSTQRAKNGFLIGTKRYGRFFLAL